MDQIKGPEKDLDYHFMFFRVFVYKTNIFDKKIVLEKIMSASIGLCG